VSLINANLAKEVKSPKQYDSHSDYLAGARTLADGGSAVGLAAGLRGPSHTGSADLCADFSLCTLARVVVAGDLRCGRGVRNPKAGQLCSVGFRRDHLLRVGDRLHPDGGNCVCWRADGGTGVSRIVGQSVSTSGKAWGLEY
jgi:hypothetical protein